MTRLTDFFGAQDTIKKVQVLTSGTSWTAPANLLDGLVSVTMIGAGQARKDYYNLSGLGGSVITEAMVPVVATTAYTYAIGTQPIQLTDPITTSDANAGGNTVFNYEGGAMTAFGGAANTAFTDPVVTGGAGASSRGLSSGSFLFSLGAGKYGCYAPWTRFGGSTSARQQNIPDGVGGGGIMINGVIYGTGGNNYEGGLGNTENVTNYGRQGVIYLQWREKIA